MPVRPAQVRLGRLRRQPMDALAGFARLARRSIRRSVTSRRSSTTSSGSPNLGRKQDRIVRPDHGSMPLSPPEMKPDFPQKIGAFAKVTFRHVTTAVQASTLPAR
jgi:hypothetical protein